MATFVARQLKYGFNMPLVIDGEPQFKKDPNGGKIVSAGRFVPEMISIEFTNVCPNVKLGYHSEYTTEDPAIIAYIEKNILPTGLVMTIDKYKQDKNPELWKSEQEKKQIAEGLKARDEKISVQERQLAELREKLERIQGKNRQ